MASHRGMCNVSASCPFRGDVLANLWQTHRTPDSRPVVDTCFLERGPLRREGTSVCSLPGISSSTLLLARLLLLLLAGWWRAGSRFSTLCSSLQTRNTGKKRPFSIVTKQYPVVCTAMCAAHVFTNASGKAVQSALCALSYDME